MITNYELQTLEGKFVRKFQVKSERKPYEQQIINRVMELGHNPLLYYYKELKP